jgi:PKD repeat protein
MMATAFTACYQETQLLVNAQFKTNIVDSNFTAPVQVTIENNTTGADFFRWSIKGGDPDTSKEKNPGTIVYEQAGNYTIKLTAWNNNERGAQEFTFSVDSAVSIGFTPQIVINDFAPADVSIHNTTSGGSSFLWTFDGGTPQTSTEKNPDPVRFDSAGTHTISLTVNNGRKTFAISKTVTLQPKIHVDFDLIPSFDDYDYEVPFTANLTNKTTSGLTYLWKTTGGTIVDKTAQNTSITITSPGTYTVTLEGNNEKETKSVSKQVTVKENSNLYTMTDVRFGIKIAESTIGCSYSLSDRRIYASNEITASNGSNIDLVFFGLDATFSRCYFLSPDNVYSSGFYTIPGASKTFVVNDVSSVGFTDSDFLSMTNDSKLRTLTIKDNSNSTAFTNTSVPRLVLFETASGRKGAIRIKSFVSNGASSYILADIKVQK